MTEYNYKEKKLSIDTKFKTFSHIIKNCTICKGIGYSFVHSKDEFGLICKSVAKECSCVKRCYTHAIYKEANIPSEYWDLSMKNFFENDNNKEIKEIIVGICKDIKMFNQSGKGLLFYGGPGTGKSMLGLEVLKQALKHGMTGHYDWFPKIMDVLMSKSFEMDTKKNFYNEMFENKDFLVIDELGKETQDGFGFNKQDIARILEINILKNRGNKTTILISNLANIEEIKNQYGVYVDSVIRQNFKTINLEGKDFRNVGSVNQFFDSLKEK